MLVKDRNCMRLMSTRWVGLSRTAPPVRRCDHAVVPPTCRFDPLVCTEWSLNFKLPDSEISLWETSCVNRSWRGAVEVDVWLAAVWILIWIQGWMKWDLTAFSSFWILLWGCMIWITSRIDKSIITFNRNSCLGRPACSRKLKRNGCFTKEPLKQTLLNPWDNPMRFTLRIPFNFWHHALRSHFQYLESTCWSHSPEGAWVCVLVCLAFWLVVSWGCGGGGVGGALRFDWWHRWRLLFVWWRGSNGRLLPSGSWWLLDLFLAPMSQTELIRHMFMWVGALRQTNYKYKRVTSGKQLPAKKSLPLLAKIILAKSFQQWNKKIKCA